MKICNIICSDGISGHEKPILEMHNFFCENNINSNFFFFTKNKYLKKIFIKKKINIQYIDIIIYKNIFSLFIKIFLIIKNNNKSIIHSHLTYADIFCSIIKRYFLNFKLITTRPYDYSYNSLKKYFYFFIYKYICNFDAQVCISDNVANLVLHFENFEKKRTFIVYYGLSFNPISKIKILNNKRINISMVGRLLKWKNHYQILLYLKNEKFLNYIKSNNIFFTIYGNGPLYNFLFNEIKRNNLDSYIKIKKDINDQNIIFNYSDILLHPSTFEGFGLVAIEAMSHRIPVICNTNLGMSSSVNIISPNLVIDIFSLDSVINSLEYTIVNYEILSLKSYKLFLNKFTINSMSDNYLSIYNSLYE